MGKCITDTKFHFGKVKNILRMHGGDDSKQCECT